MKRKIKKIKIKTSFLLISLLFLFFSGAISIFSLKYGFFFLLFSFLSWFLISYPQISFGLFLLAGYFKAEPHLKNFLPSFFDLTVYFALITVLAIFLKIRKRNYKLPKIPFEFLFPYLLLLAWMAGSLLWSLSSIYAKDKFLRFLCLTTLATFLPFFLFEKRKDFYLYFYTLLFISTSMSIFAFIFPSERPGFKTAFGSNYLALGRATGISSLFLLYGFFPKRSKISLKILGGILLILNLLALFLSGARGPALSFLGVVLILTFFAFLPRISKDKMKIFKIGIAFFLILILVFSLFPELFSRTISRIKVIIKQEKGGVSFSKRIKAWRFATRAFFEHPISGVGVGGFSVYFSGKDLRKYPHNIILEIASELGIIGISSFLALFFFTLFLIKKLKRNLRWKEEYLLVVATLAIFLFTFLNSFISGDINDNRIFFAFLGTAWSLNNLIKNKKKKYG